MIKKDCHGWQRLWWLKKIVMIEKDCDKENCNKEDCGDWKGLWWLKKAAIKKIHACNKTNLVLMKMGLLAEF